MKRLIDIASSLAGLIVLSPILLILMFMIWREDGKSPFYIAPRIGRHGRPFSMIKLRSMVMGADKIGADSTACDDPRITPVGGFVRKYKFDEFMQLWNVLKGDMSLVGPRPNVTSGVELYTNEELKLLDVKPGITDFSSIVFADEGDILEGSEDPDFSYNELIRPWKSRLGLFYIEHQNIILDFRLIILTVMAILSRQKALAKVQVLLLGLGADEVLVDISGRYSPLQPCLPPGASEDISARG